MNNFESFGLSQKVNNALVDMKFTTPTPIQQKAIPIVLNGFDILGSAQTGTGKTAAFCIPIIEMLAKDDKSIALIMMPTRELARQVIDVVNQLTNNGDKIKSACLIGGEAMRIQTKQLSNYPRIIVGTPGRINDHLENKKVNLKNCIYVVLDETSYWFFPLGHLRISFSSSSTIGFIFLVSNLFVFYKPRNFFYLLLFLNSFYT